MSFEECMNWMEERSRERKAEREADHQEHLKYMERREADHQEHKEKMERMDKESEARRQKHLKEMDEIRNGPPIPYPIVKCPIPSPPVKQVSTLQVYPSFPIIDTSIASRFGFCFGFGLGVLDFLHRRGFQELHLLYRR